MDIHAFSFGSVFITLVYSQVCPLIPHLPTTAVSILTFWVQFRVAFCLIFIVRTENCDACRWL